MTFACTLSYPPSANRLWRAVNGRNIRSAEYRAWLDNPFTVQSKAGDPISGAYRMVMEVERPDARRRDLSNLVKPVEDLLQAYGFVRDDCDALQITLQWGAAAKPARVYVTLEPVVERLKVAA